MAWIKVKDKFGRELCVPEGAYRNFYAGNSAYKLVQESKPAPIKKVEEKKEEVVNDEQIQQPRRNEDNSARKGTKKVG